MVGRWPRQDADRHRAPAVRLRRLPVVGHRHRDRPSPELARERIRGTARRHAADDGLTDRRLGGRHRADRTPASTRSLPNRRRRTPLPTPRRPMLSPPQHCLPSPRAIRSPASRCHGSASTRSSWPASRRATSRRDRATIRRRHCRGSSGTRRSPGTAPPSGNPSSTSTSSTSATRSSSPRSPADTSTGSRARRSCRPATTR